MRRALFRDLKTELARVAGVTGYKVTDARFVAALNKATEELMGEGDFPGVVDRYRFVNSGGYITLPADLERIVGVAINNVPVEMRSPWYELVQDGPGPQDEYTGLDLGLDRGEVCCVRDIPSTGGPYTLRIHGQVDEQTDSVRPKITIRGYDQNGEWVRTETADGWIDGEEFEINGDTAPLYVESESVWTHIESVIKPETNGFVRLWAYDGTDEYYLASYAPRETRPTYRRYFFPHLRDTDEPNVLLRARRRFIPITGDNDWMVITNLNALECMLSAHRMRETDKVAEYMALKAAAVDLLKKESVSYHGKTPKPAMTFSQGFSIGNMPHLV